MPPAAVCLTTRLRLTRAAPLTDSCAHLAPECPQVLADAVAVGRLATARWADHQLPKWHAGRAVPGASLLLLLLLCIIPRLWKEWQTRLWMLVVLVVCRGECLSRAAAAGACLVVLLLLGVGTGDMFWCAVGMPLRAIPPSFIQFIFFSDLSDDPKAAKKSPVRSGCVTLLVVVCLMSNTLI